MKRGQAMYELRPLNGGSDYQVLNSTVPSHGGANKRVVAG